MSKKNIPKLIKNNSDKIKNIIIFIFYNFNYQF